MGLDIDKLVEGLLNYNQSLNKDLQKLRDDFDALMSTYLTLNQEYEGQEAEEFKNSWDKTAKWFEEYIGSAIKLSKTLEERIGSLKELSTQLVNPHLGLSNNNINIIVKNPPTIAGSVHEPVYFNKAGITKKVSTENWKKKSQGKEKGNITHSDSSTQISLNKNKLENLLEILEKDNMVHLGLGKLRSLDGELIRKLPLNSCRQIYILDKQGFNDQSHYSINTQNLNKAGNFSCNEYYYCFGKKNNKYNKSFVPYYSTFYEEVKNIVKEYLEKQSYYDYFQIAKIVNEVLNKLYPGHYALQHYRSQMIKDITNAYIPNTYLRFNDSFSGLPLE